MAPGTRRVLTFVKPMLMVTCVLATTTLLGACTTYNKRPAENCHIHGDRIVYEMVRDPTVSGRMLRQKAINPRYEAAKRELFPFGERTLSEGCIIREYHFLWAPQTNRLWYCPSCRVARDEWLASQVPSPSSK